MIAGDKLTYYIEPEKEKGERQKKVLICSIIRTRRKNIGIHTEYVNYDPAYSDFFLFESDDVEHADPDNDIMMDHFRVEESTTMTELIPGSLTKARQRPKGMI
jgi:hypothetical protein